MTIKGEKGIRTLDTVSMSVFKTDAIDRSAISPKLLETDIKCESRNRTYIY